MLMQLGFFTFWAMTKYNYYFYARLASDNILKG